MKKLKWKISSFEYKYIFYGRKNIYIYMYIEKNVKLNNTSNIKLYKF